MIEVGSYWEMKPDPDYNIFPKEGTIMRICSNNNGNYIFKILPGNILEGNLTEYEIKKWYKLITNKKEIIKWKLKYG